MSFADWLSSSACVVPPTIKLRPMAHSPKRPGSFVHIGLQKTATTTLQEHLFCNHPDVTYVGRPYHDAEIEALVKAVYLHEKVEFDTEHWQRIRDAKITPCLGNGRIVGLSDEFLSAPGHHADRGVVAERLQWLLGDCLVVITIRNQVDVLRSEYIDTIKYRPYESFSHWIESGLVNAAVSSVRLYDYTKLARYYASVFGRANVGVLLFEEFLRDSDGFLDKLCSFLGIDRDASRQLVSGKHENPRKSSRLLRYKAIRSRLLPGVHFSRMLPRPVAGALLGYLHAGSPATVRISDAVRRRIEEHYRESNRALAMEYSLPIAAYGYAR
jgi:hypothetical protein